MPARTIYKLYYYTKRRFWYHSTTIEDPRFLEEIRNSYRRCGWCTAIERIYL